MRHSILAAAVCIGALAMVGGIQAAAAGPSSLTWPLSITVFGKVMVCGWPASTSARPGRIVAGLLIHGQQRGILQIRWNIHCLLRVSLVDDQDLLTLRRYEALHHHARRIVPFD